MARQPMLIAKRLTVDGLNNMGVQPPIIDVPRPKFPAREHDAEMRILYELDQGVDEEDTAYLKQSFQKYVLLFSSLNSNETDFVLQDYVKKDILVLRKLVGLIILRLVIQFLSNPSLKNIEQVLTSSINNFVLD